MIGEIRRCTPEQFVALLHRPWHRRIAEVHIHHTWRPRQADWRGEPTVRAMRDFHVREKGWSDIAQHLTIGPDGSLWTGRHLDMPPASATGHNGSSREGPLMIEMVGDFDRGREPFMTVAADGTAHGTAQAEAAFQTVASICRAFDLPVDRIRFHNEFTTVKSCPGTSIQLQDFRDAVEQRLQAVAGEGARGLDAATPSVDEEFAQRYLALFGTSDEGSRAVAADEGETDYSEAQAAWFADQAGVAAARGFDEPDLEIFRRHVVNLEMGRLSDSGEFFTKEEDLDALIEHVATWLQDRTHQPGRIVFYAHGGLVDEGRALREVVLRDVTWWRANNVYPIFFVWETGINEVFKEMEKTSGAERARGFSDFSDAVLERTLGPLIGRPTWRRIKNNALLSSSALLTGEKGGARIFIEKFAEKMATLKASPTPPSFELHAVGHSAGAIFHCHFLPALGAALGAANGDRPPFLRTLALLAPAGRVDLFKSALMPLVGKAIGACAVFTMNQGSEEADNVAHIYRKSLLYFVRNACEESGRPPILGLEESIRADAQLMGFFGLGDRAGIAEVIWSPTPDSAPPSSSTKATSHGGFDDDAQCMNSVLRRILDLPNAAALPVPNLGSTGKREEAGRDLPFGAATLAAKGARRFALCVGIDEYRTRPLSGCVADARAWGQWLESAGFSVEYLLDSQATKRAMLRAMASTMDRARAGDVVVIQFAGHGTQVTDVSGDEKDRLDEAWVPQDYEQGEFVIDDELGVLFDGYRNKGFEFVLFTDCCHSGTSTRVLFQEGDPELGRNSRYLPITRELDERFVARQRAQPSPSSTRVDDKVGWEIHFAACQDDQSAYEEQGHGKFTLAALKVLKSQAKARTYGVVAEALVGAFRKDTRQTPNFRALPEYRSRALFGSRAVAAAASGPAAPDVAAALPTASDRDDVVERLDSIERRLDELLVQLRKNQ